VIVPSGASASSVNARARESFQLSRPCLGTVWRSCRTKTKFDGVLIDAPCTGIGNMAKKSTCALDDDDGGCARTECDSAAACGNAAASVKPGGKLIYAVCTLPRTETDAVADFCSQQLSGFAPCPLPVWPVSRQQPSGRKWICPSTFVGTECLCRMATTFFMTF